MRCRHTVPDWHRYVQADQGAPIFAACRLLIQEGQPAADPRSIACGFWGRQPDCPLYDGPGKRAEATHGLSVRATQDEPLSAEKVWPVRAPGTPDRMRVGLIALVVVSIALLLWGVFVVAAGLQEEVTRVGVGAILCVAIITQLLSLVRIWARR